MSDSITMREAWRLDIEELKAERDEARIQFRSVEALGLALVKTIDELKAERNEAINHLSTIAEDCEAWLNSQIDEPSMEFIKAVRDYAKKAI